ncbi:MAG: NADH-quinone oxidoreductase subunit J [Actinomycetota bacterium]
MSADQIVFWILAPISVASAVLMLLQRNAVHSALFLIVNFFCLSVFFLVLGSPFLFVVQIVVYAGAIMVLFLFVIMLLGVDQRESLIERLKGQRFFAIVLALAVAAEITTAVRLAAGLAKAPPAGFDAVNEGGNVRALAEVLFKDYFLPFEVTSILLIIAAIAAMVLTKRRFSAPEPEGADASVAGETEETAA